MHHYHFEQQMPNQQGPEAGPTPPNEQQPIPDFQQQMPGFQQPQDFQQPMPGFQQHQDCQQPMPGFQQPQDFQQQMPGFQQPQQFQQQMPGMPPQFQQQMPSMPPQFQQQFLGMPPQQQPFPMFPQFPGMQPPDMMPGQQPPTSDTPGMLPVEQSYIENILRLNRGKTVRVYMTFENNPEWNSKVFVGVVEEAGRDHIVISNPETGIWYLLLMVNLDFIEFEEEINYEYPYRG